MLARWDRRSRSRAARFRAAQFRAERFSAGGSGSGGAELSNATDEKDMFILFFTSSYS